MARAEVEPVVLNDEVGAGDDSSTDNNNRKDDLPQNPGPKGESDSKSPGRRVRSGQKSPVGGHKAELPPSIKGSLREGQSALDVFNLDDVGGLPLEIWRVVLAYLPVYTLCKCSQVSKSWRHLVNSLDQTTWKGYYKRSLEWKDPGWPTFQYQDEKKTWQALYKEHYLAARTWTLCNKEAHQTGCVHVFRKKRERKIIRVGPLYEHSSLKSALSVASEYDRIILAPGLYDEQFEMSSKIPFELVGEGELGSVILLTCIEQNALTARLCNLVLRAPWFTAHVLKVVSGHLQVDNCIIEDGQVSIISPGTAHLRYCSFVRTQITCSKVSLSLIENSNFTECETCAIVVEGAPWGEANWAHKHLLHCADTYKIRQQRRSSKSSPNASQICHEECSIADFDLGSNLTLDRTETDKLTDKRSFLTHPSERGVGEGISHLGSDLCSDNGESESESSCSEVTQSVVQTSYAGGQPPGPAWLSDSVATPPIWDKDAQPLLAQRIADDDSLKELISVVIGCMVRQCRISNGQGGVTVANQGAVRIEQSDLCDLQYGIRCLQNAKVVAVENALHRCSTSGIFMRLGASGIVAGNDIHSTGEAGIDIRKNADPLIQFNRIHHSKRSGVVVLGCGRGTIKANDIYQNREAGIYILYKGDPYITENRICHGEAAGISVTESGKGYIGGNLISGNRWGGIDVRRGANPRVTRNLVCNGLADGIVIGTKGCGTIDANVIRGNIGCGIWVMSGRPTIQCNQVYNNKDSGIVLVHKESDASPSAEGSDSDSDIGGDSFFQPSGNTTNTTLPTSSPTNTDTTNLKTTCSTNLKFNSVYHNAGHGLVANSGESVLVHGNGFHGNRSVGVHVRQAACMTLTSNSITSNAGTGIQVDSQAKVEIEGNGIYDNIGCGMIIHGDVKLVKNDIFYNQVTAVAVQAGANAQILENRLYSPYDPAITLDKAADGVVVENTLYEGRAKPTLQHPAHTTFRISDNNFKSADGLEPGVRRDGNWTLNDPPPRPDVEAPPAISIPSTPARHVMSVTRVMSPAGGSCQQGSKMCIIL